VNLYLTGHTHGGQICLPVLGPLLKNAQCTRAQVRGLWRHKAITGHTLTGYTSPGLGCTSAPVRYNCPPEATILELRRGVTA
jgi:predicted MPP superfamily phosphohydrolase